ncbi:four and a half LIM domains protein 3-like isoform X2 [Xiphophorus hellerii]|uniref:four and a half LIM domains protein 3-like isoform X2 n=1 Tax=Xiphophorus hellerii TaxID=8084 RepID=UPI0013B363B1|nr:four and a half LIM domains protein 3-like isoform X2 [Xiphophorus hellerii]
MELSITAAAAQQGAQQLLLSQIYVNQAPVHSEPDNQQNQNQNWTRTRTELSFSKFLVSEVEESELVHQDRFFHENCFRCCSCNRSLAAESFTQQGGALLCSSCYCSSFSSRCAACSQSVQPGSRMLEYDGAAWHEDCFLCSGCRKPIGAEAFVPDAGRFYCQACYEQQVAPRCSHCRKALTKGGLTYRGEVWHRDCFLCCGCGSPLAGQTFTSQGERPFCVRCFSNLYAKKCAACNAPITGFGDGKYVSFEERQWHQPCFKCSRCSVSLVGSGFFPDRDQILCADCNSDD